MIETFGNVCDAPASAARVHTDLTRLHDLPAGRIDSFESVKLVSLVALSGRRVRTRIEAA